MDMGFPGEKKHNTSTQQDILGRCYHELDPLGGINYWMYVRAKDAVGATKTVMMKNAEVTVANLTGSSNSGNRAEGIFPYVEDSGESWTTNEHRGAYLYVAGGTGAGQMKRIVKNTATRAYLRALYPNMGESDVFTTALDTTSDVVIVNPWHITPTLTAAVNPTVGVAPFAFTDEYYGYILVPKPPVIALVKAGGTLTINHYVKADDDTSGQVVDAGALAAETVVGKALHASAADQGGPIHLMDL